MPGLADGQAGGGAVGADRPPDHPSGSGGRGSHEIEAELVQLERHLEAVIATGDLSSAVMVDYRARRAELEHELAEAAGREPASRREAERLGRLRRWQAER